MTLLPLQQAGPIVVVHACAAVAAVVLGLLQFLLPKGGMRHRILGYAWVTFMALVAISSFFIFKIRVIGPFSPIHLLSIITLVSLVLAIRAARLGKIGQHRMIMFSLYFFALIIAGAFTLLPSRIMGKVLFGA